MPLVCFILRCTCCSRRPNQQRQAPGADRSLGPSIPAISARFYTHLNVVPRRVSSRYAGQQGTRKRTPTARRVLPGGEGSCNRPDHVESSSTAFVDFAETDRGARRSKGRGNFVSVGHRVLKGAVRGRRCSGERTRAETPLLTAALWRRQQAGKQWPNCDVIKRRCTLT